MAVTESIQLQPDYIEALGKTYAADLTRQAGIPSITTADTQQAGETAATTAGGLTGAMTGAQLATMGAPGTAQAGQVVTPTLAPGSYMSPYQQQVIDATMTAYDAQAAKSRLGLGAQAVSGGAFGGGRHGIAEAEFDVGSNIGRASLQSGLRQQGFQQAQQARQQDLANQMGLANLQTGLGQQAQGFGRAQIAGLGTLGAGQQAQNQAVLDAQRQFAQMGVQEPINRMNMLGTGVMGLMGGMAPYGTEIGEAPETASSSPLATALGTGLMGADIYGRIFGNKAKCLEF